MEPFIINITLTPKQVTEAITLYLRTKGFEAESIKFTLNMVGTTPSFTDATAKVRQIEKPEQ